MSKKKKQKSDVTNISVPNFPADKWRKIVKAAERGGANPQRKASVGYWALARFCESLT